MCIATFKASLFTFRASARIVSSCLGAQAEGRRLATIAQLWQLQKRNRSGGMLGAQDIRLTSCVFNIGSHFVETIPGRYILLGRVMQTTLERSHQLDQPRCGRIIAGFFQLDAQP